SVTASVGAAWMVARMSALVMSTAGRCGVPDWERVTACAVTHSTARMTSRVRRVVILYLPFVQRERPWPRGEGGTRLHPCDSAGPNRYCVAAQAAARLSARLKSR